MADVLPTDTMQLPVWVVQAENWHCHVPINEYNNQFPAAMQAMEAATQAVESYKGIRDDITIILKEGEEKPKLGAGLIVFLKDTDPRGGFAIWSHVPLGNAGCYKDSAKVWEVIKKDFEQIEREQARSNKLQGDIGQFEKFQQTVRKPKKPIKKSSKKGSRKKLD